MLSQLVEQKRATNYGNMAKYIQHELFSDENKKKIDKELHHAAKNGITKIPIMYLYPRQVRGCCIPEIMWDYHNDTQFIADICRIVYRLHDKWKEQFPGTYISNTMEEIIVNIV